MDREEDIFDKLYSEVWELPGRIVLSDDDIIKVVYRLIAIGLQNVQAFVGFGADDIVALLLDPGYDMDIEAPIEAPSRFRSSGRARGRADACQIVQAPCGDGSCSLTLTPGRAVIQWRYVVLRFIVVTESQVGEDHDERY